MRDYAELVKALRICASDNFCDERCPRFKERPEYKCLWASQGEAADVIEELLAELTTIRKQFPRWISVEERLPPVYKDVLSCDKYGLVKENYMISDKDWSVGYHITHWMPLPAPPKGVE